MKFLFNSPFPSPQYPHSTMWIIPYKVSVSSIAVKLYVLTNKGHHVSERVFKKRGETKGMKSL